MNERSQKVFPAIVLVIVGILAGTIFDVWVSLAQPSQAGGPSLGGTPFYIWGWTAFWIGAGLVALTLRFRSAIILAVGLAGMSAGVSGWLMFIQYGAY